MVSWGIDWDTVRVEAEMVSLRDLKENFPAACSVTKPRTQESEAHGNDSWLQAFLQVLADQKKVIGWM